MPFLGSTPPANYKTLTKQTITGDSSTAYTLNEAVANANEIEVFVNNVRQQPTTDYTANNRTITFTDPLLSSDSCWLVYQGKAESTTIAQTGNIADGAITNAKISGVAASKLTGALPALDGSALTGIEGLPDAIDVNASAPADSLNIDASGKVGIGTSSPDNVLHIKADAPVIKLEDNQAGGGYHQLGNSNSDGTLVIYADADGTNSSTANMRFSVGGTERMRITSDGRGLSQFTAKAWIKLHQGNNSIYDSHNVSSISHPEAGQTLVNFTNSMGYTNYCAVASSGQFYSGNCGVMDFYSGSLRVVNSNSSSYTDQAQVNVVVFGD